MEDSLPLIPMPEYLNRIRTSDGKDEFTWENGQKYMYFDGELGVPHTPVTLLPNGHITSTSSGTTVHRVVSNSPKHGLPMALKLMKKKARPQIEMEVANMKPLQHCHIVAYIAHYGSAGHFGILMYPLAETDLDVYFDRISNVLEGAEGQDWRKSDHRDPALLQTKEMRERLLHWLGCSAQAVSYLHSSDSTKGYAKHKDIKPSNFLIDKFHSILLADFGISHFQDGPEDETRDATAKTSKYASPETLEGREGRKLSTDVFSLGMVYAEMITLAYGFPRKQLYRFCANITNSENKHLTEDAEARAKPYAEATEELVRWLEKLKSEPWDLCTQNPSLRHNITDVMDLIKAMISKDPNERPHACELWQVLRKVQSQECETCKLESYEWQLDPDSVEDTETTSSDLSAKTSTRNGSRHGIDVINRPPSPGKPPEIKTGVVRTITVRQAVVSQSFHEHPIMRPLPSKIIVWNVYRTKCEIKDLSFLSHHSARKGSCSCAFWLEP
jgi:serine/threonine protein kinase